MRLQIRTGFCRAVVEDVQLGACGRSLPPCLVGSQRRRCVLPITRSRGMP